MRTIKASLKINKNGRLFCTKHQVYKVSRPPTTDCNICWTLFDQNKVQPILNKMIRDLENELKERHAR
jgi:hypothetical protein